MFRYSPIVSSPSRLRWVVSFSTFLCLCVLSHAASAATISVTSVNDSGPGSLRAAIAASASGDTINFDSTIFLASSPKTIILTSGQLNIGQDLTIQGPGSNVLTISGNKQSREFYLSSGTISISGVTIANGTIAGYYGGGIYNNSATLALTACNIISNTASDGNGAIGVCAGLYNSQGTVTITNCSITGNSATGECGGVLNGGTMTLNGCILTGNSGTYAGAILNNGALTMTNCSLTNNKALYGDGGALFCGGGEALTQCNFSNNSAAGNGGAISANGYRHNSHVLIACNLSGNTAGGDGGGLLNDGYASNVTMTNCTMDGNSAKGAGGGIKNGGNDGGILTLTNCTLTANTAVSGGGIKDGGGNDTLTVTNCIIYADSATAIGQEIITSGTPTINYSDISDPFYTGTQGNININPLLVNAAGDVHLKPGSPCIGAGTASGAPGADKDGTPRPNPPTSPSIGAYELGSTLTVALDGSAQYTTIQSAINAANPGNTVLISDGNYTGPGNVDLDFLGKNITVTSVNGAAATIINCQGTYASNHRGFSLHSGETNAVISGLTIENGYEYGGSNQNGGAIYNLSLGLTVQNCVLKNNTAGNNGGGIYSDNEGSGGISITNCTVASNLAGSSGGGIFNYNGSSGTFTVSNCTFTNNSTNYAGGIYNENASNGTIMVANCTFTGNMAPNGDSGGIYNSNHSGAITVDHCTLTSNTTSSGFGGGMKNDNYMGSISVTNCTLTSNTASYGGGGLYNFNAGGGSGTITVNNCQLTGNSSDNSGVGGGLFNYNGGTSIIIVTDCALASNTASYGGGLFNENINSGTITLTNCTVTSNAVSSGGNGGGIYNENSKSGGTISVINCTLTGNTAPSGSGGGCYNTNSGTLSLINNILYSYTGGEVANNPSGTSNPMITYCDIQGNPGTPAMPDVNYNFSADPLFVNAPAGDVHLKPGSPCVAKGTPNGTPATDKDGMARPNPPTIGAYEGTLAALASISFSPSSVTAGGTTTGTLTLTGPAPSGAAIVHLTSSNPAALYVPPTAQLNAGLTSRTFTAVSKNVTTAQTVTVTATYNGTSATATVTVNPAPVYIGSVSFNPSTVTAGANTTGTLTLTGPAPAGNAVVQLSSSNPAALYVPPTAQLNAGLTSRTFTAVSKNVTATQTVTVTATYNGTSTTTTVTINPAPVYMGSVSFSPSTVTGGSNTTGTLTLTGPAPAGNAIVHLTSSNPAALYVPATAQLNAGLTSRTITAVSHHVSTAQTVTVTATYNGTSKTTQVTVTP